ncbi:MAG TPA: HD domain-containing protein [Anaerolineales bacterium]|nr:HD domain-containing protein [Anaerolineales bacterium]
MEEQNNTNHSPYAGRWVALVRGRVVAQGGTPEQALRASQSSRYKERPEIRFMSVPFNLPPLLEKIVNVLPANTEIYLVGGAVRDLLTNRRSPDFDFAVPSNGISLARTVANALKADFMVLDGERDTGRVIIIEDGTYTYLDFAAYRGATLEEDLRDRDFTINAIALNLRDITVIDPLNGATDIRAKVIRACSPDSLSNDPVRILRAVRQAAAFGFSIDKSTREWMKQAADKINNVSIERVRDEVFKMLGGPKASASIRALEMLGVLQHLMPELLKMKGVTQSNPHIHEVWVHTLAVVDQLEDLLTSSLRLDFDPEKTSDMFMGLISLKIGRYREQIAKHFANQLNPSRSHRSLLMFSALYHDICKPDTKTIDENGRIRFFDHDIKGAEVVADRARAFNLSNDEVERLHTIVRHHMRFHFFADRLEREGQPPSRKAVYRFFRDSGAAGVDLILLALADLRGTKGNELTQVTWTAYLDIARILLENYWEHPEEVVNPPRLVDGNELMKELNLQPGKVVGVLLESIRENQAAGKIVDKEQALEFARVELTKGVNEA